MCDRWATFKKKLESDRSYGFIINLSKKSEPGSHWVSVYIDNNPTRKNKRKNGKSSSDAYYFDPYVLFRPKSWQLIKFLNKNARKVEYNGQQLQQLHSNVCGMYAACFIIHMANGNRFNFFLDKFSKNLLINDLFIAKIFNYYIRNK